MTDATFAELLVIMKAAGLVAAKTRKRCPQCHKMVEVGEDAVLRDNRYQQSGAGATPWIGNRQTYTRGAWNLYHPACFEQLARSAVDLSSH